MKLYLIRHGETDWRLAESRGARGWATSFAPLTPLGRLQIDTIARDYRLQEVEAIVCSSYARALESAALLSRALNKPFYVEYDLHEWLPSKDPLRELDADGMRRAMEALREGRPAPEGAWETLEEVRARSFAALARYARFGSLAVVTHAVVIGGLVGFARPVDHAEIVPLDLDPADPPPLPRPVPGGGVGGA